MAEKALAHKELFALRETIGKMEGRPLARLEETGTGDGSGRDGRPAIACRPLGIAALDAVLEGGLPLAGMAEIRAAELRNAGAATGLALSFCALAAEARSSGAEPGAVLFIGERSVAREAGEPYAPGLLDHGLDPARFLQAAPKRLEEALWLAEAAVTSRAFSAVVLEIHGNPRRFGLSESRRLSLRARHAGCLLLLLRQGGEEEAGSTLFRIAAMPAASGHYRLPEGSVLPGTIGSAAFSLAVEKSARPAALLLPQGLTLEWNAHERLFLEPEPQPAASRSPAAAAHPGARLPASSDRQDRPAAMGAVLAFSRAS